MRSVAVLVALFQVLDAFVVTCVYEFVLRCCFEASSERKTLEKFRLITETKIISTSFSLTRTTRFLLRDSLENLSLHRKKTTEYRNEFFSYVDRSNEILTNADGDWGDGGARDRKRSTFYEIVQKEFQIYSRTSLQWFEGVNWNIVWSYIYNIFIKIFSISGSKTNEVQLLFALQKIPFNPTLPPSEDHF